MSEEQTPPTMKEAKTRFKEHTHHVLAAWAKEEIKKKKNVWTMKKGVPTLTAGTLTLEFHKYHNSCYCTA